MTLNQDKVESFNYAWKKELERNKGGKLPDYPGIGWLQNEATTRGLCMALFKTKEIDRRVVCGNKLTKDVWFCDKCLELLTKLHGTITIKKTTPAGSSEFKTVKKVIKESDLKF